MTLETDAGAASDGGAMTVDAVVAARAERREAETAQPDAAEAIIEDQQDNTPDAGAEDATDRGDQESEGDPTPEDVAGAETPTGDDIEEQQEAEQPPIQPPHSWDAEAKTEFSKLPRPLQEKIAKRESERDRAVAKALEDAAEARKQAGADTEYRQRLNAVLDRAEQTFRGKWDGMTPDAWAKWLQEEPDKAGPAKAQFDLEREELSRLQQTRQAEEARTFNDYVKAEEAKLPTVAPELADPVKGKERLEKVSEFLLEQGFQAQQLRRISAAELAVAYDALRWREAQKGMAEPLKPKLAPKPVRPAAARASSPTNARLDSARKRAAEAGSVDAVVAMRALRRQQNQG